MPPRGGEPGRGAGAHPREPKTRNGTAGLTCTQYVPICLIFWQMLEQDPLHCCDGIHVCLMGFIGSLPLSDGHLVGLVPAPGSISRCCVPLSAIPNIADQLIFTVYTLKAQHAARRPECAHQISPDATNVTNPPLIVKDNRKVGGISGIQCLGPQATPPLYSNPNRRLFPHVYLYFGPTRYL